MKRDEVRPTIQGKFLWKVQGGTEVFTQRLLLSRKQSIHKSAQVVNW